MWHFSRIRYAAREMIAGTDAPEATRYLTFSQPRRGARLPS